jgi:hypothetical protein
MIPDVCEFDVESLEVDATEIHKPTGICVIAKILYETKHVGNRQRHCLGLGDGDEGCPGCRGLLSPVAIHATGEEGRKDGPIERIRGDLTRFGGVIQKTRGGFYIHHVALAGVYETYKVSDGDFADGITTEEVERIVGFGAETQEGSGTATYPVGPGPPNLERSGLFRDIRSRR